jgi:hypothetical protein
MKKIILTLIIGSLSLMTVFSQGGLLKKVTGAMKDELLGKGGQQTASQEPEPDCACESATVVLKMGGNLQLDYRETSITVQDDGSLLAQDKITGKYYIIKNGAAQGPIPANDSMIESSGNYDPSDISIETAMARYKNFLSYSSEKYTITFGGKSYGPYSQVTNFVVTPSKTKFAAVVIENMPVNEADGKKIEDAMKNAKNDDERMELSMQYAQMMQQRMLSGGGPQAMMPKLVTNIEGATWDPLTQMGAILNGKMKYDDILMDIMGTIKDLKGNPVISLKDNHRGVPDTFVSSDNSRYAVFSYGTLRLSDGKTLSGLFNPHLVRADGKTWLSYMYFSPKNNAIMECRIPF